MHYTLYKQLKQQLKQETIITLTYKLLIFYKTTKQLGGSNKKKMGQKIGWANELGGPNTKLDGPVPSRPTHSTATATTSITLPIINYIISSDTNSFIIVIIVLLSLKK